jgi:predicted transcriptional regulator
MKYKSYTTLKSELLSDPEVKAEYVRLEPEYKLIEQIIRKRIQKSLTQSQLAKLAGTKQSAISRLESGSYNPSLNFLQKISRALNSQLQITLN